jgi:hypothetical protein
MITGSMSSSVESPAQRRMPTAAEYSIGSPHQVTTPRRFGGGSQSAGSPQGLARSQRHDSFSTQMSPTTRSGRASFSSNHLRAPTMSQDPNVPSLTGVPQVLAVQEMAFRQGQRDHGGSRERYPPSPFAKQFDDVWVEYYVLGKATGGTPNESSTPDAPAYQNFPWPVLINPYTQDLEHPNGSVDSEWVRKVCNIGLNCMAALIGTVCRRQGDWRKTTCDVPTQIKQALLSFDDLRARYEKLSRDAREAGAGGLPAGY